MVAHKGYLVPIALHTPLRLTQPVFFPHSAYPACVCPQPGQAMRQSIVQDIQTGMTRTQCPCLLQSSLPHLPGGCYIFPIPLWGLFGIVQVKVKGAEKN